MFNVELLDFLFLSAAFVATAVTLFEPNRRKHEWVHWLVAGTFAANVLWTLVSNTSTQTKWFAALLLGSVAVFEVWVLRRDYMTRQGKRL